MDNALEQKKKQARSLIIDAGERLLREGLVARTWGNISVRIDEYHMAITPSGIPYRDLDEDKIVIVDLRDDTWTGPWRPSGERKIHRAIYLAREDVHAVIHTHQNAASVLAAARIGVPAGYSFGTPERTMPAVACARYALPGTKSLTRSTLDALGNSNAVLLANHGVVCVGADLDTTFATIRELESACSAYLIDKAAEKNLALPCPPDEPWTSGFVSEPEPETRTAFAIPDGAGILVSNSPYTLAYAGQRKKLGPVLDDIAQIVGPVVRSTTIGKNAGQRKGFRIKADSAVLVPEVGAICVYRNPADAEAAAMVIEKSCRAAIAGSAVGGSFRIPLWEAALMRFVYRNSYAKQGARATTK